MKINNKEEGGEEKIREFVRGLVERNKVAEDEKETEEERLAKLVEDKIFEEILQALPEEDLDEIGGNIAETNDFPEEKLYAKMFENGIRPESIVDKVLREIEREYLGVENVESEENLISAEEEE